MLHKWESFSTAIGRVGEVLFVRLGSFRTPPIAWPCLPEADVLAMSRVNRLQRTLAATFPDARCRLLRVLYPEITPFHADEPADALVSAAPLASVPQVVDDSDVAASLQLKVVA